MELTIITPDYEATKHIAWIEINTPKGNYIIQNGHAPFIIALSAYQPLTYQLESGKKETVAIQSGVIDINRKKVMIIVKIARDNI